MDNEDIFHDEMLAMQDNEMLAMLEFVRNLRHQPPEMVRLAFMDRFPVLRRFGEMRIIDEEYCGASYPRWWAPYQFIPVNHVGQIEWEVDDEEDEVAVEVRQFRVVNAGLFTCDVEEIV